MTPKLINGYTVYAYSIPPQGREPARAFMETRKEGADAEPRTFEIYLSRRFRSGVEAMSAARNALASVKWVDENGIPDHLPE
ncbi:hypothetical protein CAL14_12855 [Bordetella genomosp. 9]|uniref:hypothetical protein n=1 Tax=Bordetella genomosp. 9 TaxID=1416803 RepID=UPI000A2905FB|nr:hypothetical protein [Bordetella genomosp. 9]ARP91069.1 hypothetical protein CAL14_12855 [Bordetella genomosp. 9]